MKNEINLLHSKTSSPFSAFANKIDILRTIALFLLFLVSFLSVVFFFLVLVSPLPALRKEENTKRLALRSLYGKISDLYIINDRVKGISEVLDNRLGYEVFIGEIIDNLPKEVSIRTIKSVKEEILISVSSSSLTSLQSYFDTLVEHNKTQKLFTSITQSNLAINQNTTSVEVQIALGL